VDDALLEAPWPPHLNPATVPFRTRRVTVLRRAGFFDDWSLFNTLTEVQVLSWTTAGVGTVADIRTTGNTAIVEYDREALSLGRSVADLVKFPYSKHDDQVDVLAYAARQITKRERVRWTRGLDRDLR